MSIPSSILSAYRNLFSESVWNYNEIGNSTHRIPRFTELNLKSLCTKVIEVLQNESTLIVFNSNAYVVGDLHGSLSDLLRILHTYGIPPMNKYIFLGDYVDRGEYSLEVVILLLALKCLYPAHIILLRGNHEFREINYLYGFYDQCVECYSAEIYEAFNDVFANLPLAVITDDRTILLHGGISEKITSIEQIKEIPKPLQDYIDTPYRQIVLDIVWSDPCVDESGYQPSKRGTGSIFGAGALKKFLTENNLTKMIRGHQCISTGVQQCDGMDLYTVFSCSSYTPDYANLSGVLKLTNGNIKCLKLPPLKKMPRSEAYFTDVDASVYQPPLFHPSISASTKFRKFGGPVLRTQGMMRKRNNNSSKKIQRSSSSSMPRPMSLLL
jgi:diadenosine tetraphosphatase ApaH/serine/threonine PP2A family protein phosphatase